MSYFNFYKRLFLDPIGFSRIYLQGEAVDPLLKKRARQGYILTFCSLCFLAVPSGIASMLYLVLNKMDMSAFAALPLSLLRLILLSLCLIVALLPMVLLKMFSFSWVQFSAERWKTRTAILWAGGTDKQRAMDLGTYLTAYGSILSFFFSVVVVILVAAVAAMAKFAAADFVLLTCDVVFLLLGIATIGVLARGCYVGYKLVEEWTDANPLEVLLANTVLSLVMIGAWSFVIYGVFLPYLGAWWFVAHGTSFPYLGLI